MSTALEDTRRKSVAAAVWQAAELDGVIQKRYLFSYFRHWVMFNLLPPDDPVREIRWATISNLHSALSVDAHVFGFDDIDTASLVRGEFQFWQQQLGGFDLDAFADKSSAQLPDFGSQVHPFHSLDLHGC